MFLTPGLCQNSAHLPPGGNVRLCLTADFRVNMGVLLDTVPTKGAIRDTTADRNS